MRFVSWLCSLVSASARPQPRRVRPALETLEDRAVPSANHDILYVGDGADNTVKTFNASTGAYQGTLVDPGAGGLDGPRGLIFRNPGNLLVVNQNVNQTYSGEVLRYNGRNGNPRGAVVPFTDPNAPFAPRGMVLKGHVLYVADVEGATSPGGRVARYDIHTGNFLGSMTPTNFTGQFNPRGLAFGPDGALYVSAFNTTNLQAGYVLRFNTQTGASAVVAANNGDGIDQPGEVKNLHRPEGLVFGPDGKIYVTSFRADAADVDRILVLNRQTGAQAGEIALDQVNQDRAFAQALLFGPGGKLFVPITGGGADAGSVRRYDVVTKAFTAFVAPTALGGPLGQPWYLTFGQTDSATLDYDDGREPASNWAFADTDDQGGTSYFLSGTAGVTNLRKWRGWFGGSGA